MKLFQNLSTDLADEVVKSVFLFIALVAILCLRRVVIWLDMSSYVAEDRDFKCLFVQRRPKLHGLLFSNWKVIEERWALSFGYYALEATLVYP